MKLTRTFDFSFNNREEYFVLPINPLTFELSEANSNTKINLGNIGEIILIGKRGLVTGSISFLLPSPKSPHYARADRLPMEYINTLKKWKNSSRPFRLIITESEFNLAMVMDSIKYILQEGSEDIVCTLELSEYRFLNVPTVKPETGEAVKDNGLQSRPDSKPKVAKYVTKYGDTLWILGARFYNDGSKGDKIYQANKSKIKNPNFLSLGLELVIP